MIQHGGHWGHWLGLAPGGPQLGLHTMGLTGGPKCAKESGSPCPDRSIPFPKEERRSRFKATASPACASTPGGRGSDAQWNLLCSEQGEEMVWGALEESSS